MASNSFFSTGLHTLTSLQQLTYLELDSIELWGSVQPLSSLNLKQLVLKDIVYGAYASLLVPGNLQDLEVLDLRAMFEVPIDISHEVAVAVMLLPKLNILAGDCCLIRQIVDQSPNAWAVCTADDIVRKYGTQTAYVRIR